jgi:DNA-binding NtrC family response regulator
MGPFVVFDCAAVTENLLESELFGHLRGSFTGAVSDRAGAFRRAQKGTLFIDELTSLPLPLQSKLLRALESRRVRAVGADVEVEVDIRVIAASNRPLRDEVTAGRCRDDLYFRLSVVRAVLPALRERVEDIPLLVGHFLRSAGVEGEVAGPNLERLMSYPWPGNVRELRNVLERALALAPRLPTVFADLPIQLAAASMAHALPVLLDLPYKDALDKLTTNFERAYSSHVLDLAGGNISEAARRAGLSRRHLYNLLNRHQVLRKPNDGDDGDEGDDGEEDDGG